MTGQPEGSGAGLFEFLEWAGSKGEMNAKTADAWATASRKVLALEEDAGSVDLRVLDVDALLDRFQTLNRSKYSVESMSTYRSRFRQAVAAYLAWLANEPWKPAQRATRKKGPEWRGVGLKAETTTERTEQLREVPPLPTHTTAPRLVSYTLPLRTDLMIELTLPFDLNSADADRLAAFVRSLAFTQEPPSSSSADTTDS